MSIVVYACNKWKFLFKGNKYTKILPIALVIDAGLVCFSRIYVGVHYPFDVLGGFF